jgi:hypothetical protein
MRSSSKPSIQVFLSDILRRWKQNATESEMEMALRDWDASQSHMFSLDFVRGQMIELIYENLRARLIKLKDKGYDVARLDAFWIDNYVYDEVKWRIISLVDTWQMQMDLVGGMNLRRLAHDNQNLHNKVVVEQTNSALQLLLDHPVPPGQRTMDEIMTCWISRWPKYNFKPVFEDMTMWGKTATIYKCNDYAYRYALRGAWAKIKTYPEEFRKTLEYRLICECAESVHMCAEGHIARLANVFVGFDEAFQTELSVGEKVGNAMSALSSSELSLKEKLEEGQKILTGFGLSAEEQAPWLEALE